MIVFIYRKHGTQNADWPIDLTDDADRVTSRTFFLMAQSEIQLRPKQRQFIKALFQGRVRKVHLVLRTTSVSSELSYLARSRLS